MRSNAAVLVVLLVLTAGCSALDGTGGDEPAATPVPTTEGVATTESCEPDLLLTDEGPETVTPKPLPDRPAEFSPEAVGEFARTYERAFAHNHALGDRVRSVSVELQGTTVSAVEGGYRVRIHVWTRVGVDPAEDGAGTATTEESFYDAHYYVSEAALRRAETGRHGTLPDGDLSGSGVTLACWGE